MSDFFTKPRRSLLLKSSKSTTTTTTRGSGGTSVAKRIGAIRRRSSSSQSTLSNATTTTASSSSILLSSVAMSAGAGGGNFAVSFADEQPGPAFATNKKKQALTEEFVYESIPLDCHSDCYYTGEELIEIRREEVKAIKQALSLLAAMGRTDQDIESLHHPDPTLTWRGIEDYRDGKNRAQQARFHSVIVLREYKEQVIAGLCDSEMLRQVSKASSRDDRRQADAMADQDASHQGHKLVHRGVKRRLSRELTAMTSRIGRQFQAKTKLTAVTSSLPSFSFKSTSTDTKKTESSPATTKMMIQPHSPAPTSTDAPVTSAGTRIMANPAAA